MTQKPKPPRPPKPSAPPPTEPLPPAALGRALTVQFEISIDGTPRSYRDRKAVAIEAAEYLKWKHPHSEVVVRDLRSGEAMVVALRAAGVSLLCFFGRFAPRVGLVGLRQRFVRGTENRFWPPAHAVSSQPSMVRHRCGRANRTAAGCGRRQIRLRCCRVEGASEAGGVLRPYLQCAPGSVSRPR
jgi:hypothetical protein